MLEEADADTGLLWERLLQAQTSLFHSTTRENETLHKRVIDLERELSVWKLAFSKSDEENSSLQKSISKLERTISSLKDHNPLILCLIDGDGTIFSSELIAAGESGGRQAAMLMTKSLVDHMETVAPDSPGHSQVWVTVYFNKMGLLDTLLSHDLCTAQQFESFVTGFNQAAPLFSIIDVGHGKEAADAKIRECLRVFTRFPQTLKVFFGGAHDNGYASTLTWLQNEGLLDKIILLLSNRDPAAELKTFDLPYLKIEGVFMTEKIPPHTKRSFQSSEHELDNSKKKSKLSLIAQEEVLTRVYPDPCLPINKQKPRPCHHYYLSVCVRGNSCHYGHNYILSEENIVELREITKKTPCPQRRKNKPCPGGYSCIFGHRCPGGPSCRYLKRGTCSFSGDDMHLMTTSGTSPTPAQNETNRDHLDPPERAYTPSVSTSADAHNHCSNPV